MQSNIDPSFPETGNATTDSVRNNFAAAKAELELLLSLQYDLGAFHDYATFILLGALGATKTWLPGAPKYVSLGSTPMTANRRIALPFWLPRDMTITHVRNRITTGHASNYQIGIYDRAESNHLKPGLKLWSSGDLSAASAVVVETPAPLNLSGNRLYYLVNHYQGTPTVRNQAASDLTPFFPTTTADVNTPYPILGETIAYAELPDDLTASAMTGQNWSLPAIQLKFA